MPRFLADLSEQPRPSACERQVQMMSGSSDDTPTMADLGEKEFVRHLLGKLSDDSRLLTGHGQDASAIAMPSSATKLAFKIDRAATPVAFTHGWSDAAAWGRMAVTANCSDLLAAGSDPLAFMMAVIAPSTWLASDVEKIILAAQQECIRNGIIFAGGDTKEGPAPQIVGSAIGVYTDQLLPLSRTTAAPGHALVLTGQVGGFLGAFLQLRKVSNASKPKRDGWIEYLANPVAAWHEAAYVRQRLSPTAGVDTSDGVYDALIELTKAGVGVEIYLDQVPFHPFALECSERLGVPLHNFLFGAGDWNIAYAIPGYAASVIAADSGVNMVGTFKHEPGVAASEEGKMYAMNGPRNEHFRSRLEDGDPFVEYVVSNDWLRLIP